MRLLFTGGGGAASEALPRLLAQYEVFFADADPSVGVQVIPRGDQPGFALAVANLCRELEIDLLIPGCDEELRPLAMFRQWGALPCDVLMPAYEFIGTHLDKLQSMKTLQKLGIPVPQTWRRAIVKPREGRGSIGVKEIGHADGAIVQERLEGQEYTVTMVADKKARLRAIVPVRVGEKRRVTIRGTAVMNEAVMIACWKIHLAMPTQGVYNVQGMLTDAGFKPFEVNPRVSTTTCLALAAGVDVIGLAIDDSQFVSAMPVSFTSTTLERSKDDSGHWKNEFCEVAA